MICLCYTQPLRPSSKISNDIHLARKHVSPLFAIHLFLPGDIERSVCKNFARRLLSVTCHITCRMATRYVTNHSQLFVMAFFHTHPSGSPNPSTLWADLGMQESWWYPLGIIRTKDGYSFYMNDPKSFGPNDPSADKCIWQLTQEQRHLPSRGWQ